MNRRLGTNLSPFGILNSNGAFLWGDEMSEDLRIPITEDIVSKCGDVANESNCKHYKPAINRKYCYHNRFGFICDRLIVNLKPKEGE